MTRLATLADPVRFVLEIRHKDEVIHAQCQTCQAWFTGRGTIHHQLNEHAAVHRGRIPILGDTGDET